MPANSRNAISPKYAFQIRLVIRLGIRFGSVLNPSWTRFGMRLGSLWMRLKCLLGFVLSAFGVSWFMLWVPRGRGRVVVGDALQKASQNALSPGLDPEKKSQNGLSPRTDPPTDPQTDPLTDPRRTPQRTSRWVPTDPRTHVSLERDAFLIRFGSVLDPFGDPFLIRFGPSPGAPKRIQNGLKTHPSRGKRDRLGGPLGIR